MIVKNIRAEIRLKLYKEIAGYRANIKK